MDSGIVLKRKADEPGIYELNIGTVNIEEAYKNEFDQYVRENCAYFGLDGEPGVDVRRWTATEIFLYGLKMLKKHQKGHKKGIAVWRQFNV